MANAGPAGGFRMRPLSVGDILDETIVIYRRQFVAFVTLTAVVIVPVALLTLLMVGMLSLVGSSLESGRISAQTSMMLGIGSLAITLPVSLLATAGRLLAGVVAVKVAADVILGRPVDVWDSYRLAFRRSVPLMVAGLLVGMVVGAAGLCFPVAIFFAMSWGLILPVIVLENQGGVEAMRRSWNLMRGRRWQLLICTVVISLLAGILVGIPLGLFAVLAGVWLAVSPGALMRGAEAPFMIQAGQILFQTLGETLFMAIGYIVMTRFYFDARVRKEALDLELRLDQQQATALTVPTTP
jgi:hypothetical protein